MTICRSRAARSLLYFFLLPYLLFSRTVPYLLGKCSVRSVGRHGKEVVIWVNSSGNDTAAGWDDACRHEQSWLLCTDAVCL